nr:modifier of mdg4-like isoform X2 [Leptinotarsa decemlineata]
MTTEQFSLRWNNFHSNLTSGFHELLEAAELVDVTLAVDGHFLQAHKIVLSICSPYFKHMFKVNPCKHPIVILKDVGHENMKDILEFMYRGEVSVLRENLTQFLRTAELLQVKGLTGDDSGEEPSSPKDKTNCDNEEENEIYNQLIETDVEMPIYSPASNLASVPKRTKNTNNTSINNKRPKSENHQPQSNQVRSVKQECEPIKSKNEKNNINNCEEAKPDNVNTNSVKITPEPDDCKEPLNMNMKSIWDSTFGAAASTDLMNSSDQAKCRTCGI